MCEGMCSSPGTHVWALEESQSSLKLNDTCVFMCTFLERKSKILSNRRRGPWPKKSIAHGLELIEKRARDRALKNTNI